jgi:hypothetical protein
MMVTKYHHIVGFTMRSIGRSTAPRRPKWFPRYFLDHPLIWRIVFDAGLKSRNQVRQTREGYMREALMGVLVAAGAGLFATTTGGPCRQRCPDRAGNLDVSAHSARGRARASA